MSKIYERYTPVPVAVDTTVTIHSSSVGGFLAKTAGTITVVANAADGKAQTTIVDAHPVTAGAYVPMPFFLGKSGGTVTTAGGASGTLGV